MVNLPGKSKSKHTFEFVAPAVYGFRRIWVSRSVLVNGPEMRQDLHKIVKVHRFLSKSDIIIYINKIQSLLMILEIEKELFEKCIRMLSVRTNFQSKQKANRLITICFVFMSHLMGGYPK